MKILNNVFIINKSTDTSFKGYYDEDEPVDLFECLSRDIYTKDAFIKAKRELEEFEEADEQQPDIEPEEADIISEEIISDETASEVGEFEYEEISDDYIQRMQAMESLAKSTDTIAVQKRLSADDFTVKAPKTPKFNRLA